MCVCDRTKNTHISGFTISFGTAQHISIIDACAYPLIKCVAVSIHIVNGHKEAL